MYGRQRSPTSPPDSPDETYSRHTTEQTTQSVPAAELFELLGDEYTRAVLEAVTEQPRTGREIIETTGVSKPTVYRRLDELQEADLVACDTEIDPDGHHRKRFYAVVERVDVEVTAGGFTARVETAPDGSSSIESPTKPEHLITADD